jgi:cold shock CspA family protein
MRGRIAKILGHRGFGFVTVEVGPDLFLHCTALPRGIPFDDQLVGREIEFETSDTDKGQRVKNARLLD